MSSNSAITDHILCPARPIYGTSSTIPHPDTTIICNIRSKIDDVLKVHEANLINLQLSTPLARENEIN